MCSMHPDMKLDAMVREAVANYGQYTGEVVGLGHGRVDRVLEMQVAGLEDWEHAYTKTPMNTESKLAYGTAVRVRHFVYVVPIEVRDGREQRMAVGHDGEDLDIATFFRPIGLDAPTGDINVAMPLQAFAGDGDEVQYAFRVRNYVQLSNETLVPVDDLQIGMEFATSTQRKHSGRGVMLINNSKMFSFQLGELGDKQSGFKLQYVAQGQMADEAPVHSKAVLQTQVFGFVDKPPTPEELLSVAMQRHFHFHARRQSGGGATRGGATRSCGMTKGGSSLAHARTVQGESKHWNVSVSQAVPIAERARVELCMMVGDVARTFHEKHVEAGVALAPTELAVAAPAEAPNGFALTMRYIAKVLVKSRESAERLELQELSNIMCAWPVLWGSRADTAALAVGVIQCQDKNDEEGEAMHMTSGNHSARVYAADVGTLLRVRVTNFSLSGAKIELQPVYFKVVAGEEEEDAPESQVELHPGDSWEMPFPLQKDAGEGTDGWIFRDGGGRTVLRLLFVLSTESMAAFARQRELQALAQHERDLREREQQLREEREREARQVQLDSMVLDGDDRVRLEPECCVCLDPKTVAEMAAFVPCGHCVCCFVCHAKQVGLDREAGRQSRCPKCRVVVRDTMRLFF